MQHCVVIKTDCGLAFDLQADCEALVAVDVAKLLSIAEVGNKDVVTIATEAHHCHQWAAIGTDRDQMSVYASVDHRLAFAV